MTAANNLADKNSTTQLQKHTDLRAQNFTPPPLDLWYQLRLAKFICAWGICAIIPATPL